jgi:hypothetical protein
MKQTTDGKTNRAQAQVLQSEIQNAPSTLIPRREPILEWLKAFLIRSDRKDYVMGETEADDLTALDLFLRAYGVPVAAHAAV